jgi:hypothetical protein
MNRQFRLIVRFLDTSARVHLRSSFLSSPKSFKDLFPLSVQYRSVAQEAPRGGLLASPVQRQRRAFLHLTYSIETSSCDGAPFRAHIAANACVYDIVAWAMSWVIWLPQPEKKHAVFVFENKWFWTEHPPPSNGLYTLLWTVVFFLLPCQVNWLHRRLPSLFWIPERTGMKWAPILLVWQL